MPPDVGRVTSTMPPPGGCTTTPGNGFGGITTPRIGCGGCTTTPGTALGESPGQDRMRLDDEAHDRLGRCAGRSQRRGRKSGNGGERED